jgi:hypothetical protein
MQILNLLQTNISSKLEKSDKKKKNKAVGLSKSQRTADLFNNSLDPDEFKSPTKLTISFAMQKAIEEFKQSIDKFLFENPDIAKLLEKASLPDLEENFISLSNLNSRKLFAYLQWLPLNSKSENKETSTLEEIFIAIQKKNKDEEIKNTFHTLHQNVQKKIKERLYHSPSYYYQLFPETYSFN